MDCLEISNFALEIQFFSNYYPKAMKIDETLLSPSLYKDIIPITVSHTSIANSEQANNPQNMP